MDRGRLRQKDDAYLTEYILGKCKDGIREAEIWIPVALLHIQSEIKLGRVTLKTMTKGILDKYMHAMIERDPEHKSEIEKDVEAHRKMIQGFAASTIRVTAEPERAYEIAVKESEMALSILRVYSPSMIFPEMSSYCTFLGKENIEKYTHLLMENGQIVGFIEGLEGRVQAMVVSDQEITMMKQAGLEQLSALLAKEKRSQFEESFLSSLFLYSEAALSKNITDKLLHIIGALEMILLRNETEPIQQNVSERIAFVIGRDVEERKAIISNFKKVYNIRSRFVHHGIGSDEIDLIQEFMKYASAFFMSAIGTTEHYPTSEAFIGAIEERKLQ